MFDAPLRDDDMPRVVVPLRRVELAPLREEEKPFDLYGVDLITREPPWYESKAPFDFALPDAYADEVVRETPFDTCFQDCTSLEAMRRLPSRLAATARVVVSAEAVLYFALNFSGCA